MCEDRFAIGCCLVVCLCHARQSGDCFFPFIQTLSISLFLRRLSRVRCRGRPLQQVLAPSALLSHQDLLQVNHKLTHTTTNYSNLPASHPRLQPLLLPSDLALSQLLLAVSQMVFRGSPLLPPNNSCRIPVFPSQRSQDLALQMVFRAMLFNLLDIPYQ